MKQNQARIFLVLVIGALCLIGIALLAEPLGIDNDPGWGKGRFILLGSGVIMAFAAAMTKWGKMLEATFDPYFSRFFNLKIPTWLRQPPLLLTYLLGIGLIILASFSYLWLYSHGRIDTVPVTSRYIPMVADAFRSGQLHLEELPSDELLALENPYDPRQYTKVNAIHDASLYEGRYYMYWGPVPALLLMLLPEDFAIGDIHLSLFFASGLALTSGILLLLIWRRYFASLSGWAVLPGFAILFWSIPLPFMFAVTPIYEASILAGQLFVLLGLLFLLIGLSEKGPRYVWITFSGLSWAFAAGSRVTTTLMFIPLAGFLLWAIWKNSSWKRAQFWQSVVMLGTPLLFGAAALFWYNFARFGNFRETGMCYALSVVDMREACAHLFSVRYVPANLFLYLFRPLSILPDFPFFFLNWLTEADFPFFITLADHYYFSDPIAGIVFTLPFSLLFSVIAGLCLLSSHKKSVGRENFLLAGLLGAVLLALISLLLFFAPMSRYYADFSILLTIAAMMGFWKTLQWLENRYFLRFLVIITALCLIIWGVSAGFMTGVSGTSNAFYEDNPSLFNLIKSWFTAIGLGS